MLVIVRSSPDTSEGKRGLKMARELAADIVFLQNGVYFALNDMMEGFCGTAYALEEDIQLRGLTGQMRGIRVVGWDELIDLMADEDKVIGTF